MFSNSVIIAFLHDGISLFIIALSDKISPICILVGFE